MYSNLDLRANMAGPPGLLCTPAILKGNFRFGLLSVKSLLGGLSFTKPSIIPLVSNQILFSDYVIWTLCIF